MYENMTRFVKLRDTDTVLHLKSVNCCEILTIRLIFMLRVFILLA